MKCLKCGLDVSASSKFCSHCGNSLNEQSSLSNAIPSISTTPLPEQDVQAGTEKKHPEKYILGSRPDTYNETVVFECYPSLKVTNFQTVATAILLVIVVISIIIYKMSSGTRLFTGFFSPEVLILVIGFIGLTGYYGYKVFLTFSNHYKITTQRIFITRGLINKQIDEIELEKYKDIIVKQNFVEKIFGCGDIEVISGDSSCPVLLIPDVDNPLDKKELIRSAARERKSLLGITRREEI